MTTSYTGTPVAGGGDGSENPQPPAVHVAEPKGSLEGLLGKRVFPVPDLMPPAVLLRRRVGEARRRVGIALIVVVAVLLSLFALGRLQLATAKSDLESAQARLQAAEAEKDKYSEVPAVYAAVDAARAELAQAMGNEVQVARLVTELAAIVPPDVSLESISLVTGEADDSPSRATSVASEDVPIATVTFSGEAISFNDVSAWIEALRRQPDYQNVILTETSRDSTTGTYTFTSSAELTDQTLSGRFVEEAQ